jgi:hypothetical protein
MGNNDLWDPPETPAPGVRKLTVGGMELTLPPRPTKGAFEKALETAREKMARKDARDQGYSGVVVASAEWHRIQSIPRRILDLDEVTDLTSIFRRKGGTMVLRPIQSAALIEAHIANGLFAPIGVGWGKTLITLLMPEAMDSERTVLLVPPQLRDQLAREIAEVYGPHFNLPMDRIVRILAYSELSLAKNTDLLEQLQPDLIIADEAHNLRRSSSARTKRFIRYMRDNPHCRFVGLSGTMTTRSIMDYAHLIELSLRKNSPLPNSYKELQDWAGVLDVAPARRVQEGVLRQLCEDGENIRQGFRRRLVNTQGVVATEESALGTSLMVEAIQPPLVPASVVDALHEVEATWAFQGEEYADPLSMWRFRRQISVGFYYRWVWPDGKPDEEWLEARAAWKRAARDKVKLGRAGMDSEFLVASAAERWRKSIEDHSNCEGVLVGDDHSECLVTVNEIEDAEGVVVDEVEVKTCKVNPRAPGQCTGKPPKWKSTKCKIYPHKEHAEYCSGEAPRVYSADTVLFESEEWIAWKKLKTRYNPTPPKEAVWLSDWLAYDVERRARDAASRGHKVIIWYMHKCMGERVAELSGLPHYGQGEDASASTEDIIICSVTTQGTGKNLQHFNYNIAISMVTNGKDFEQKVGRTHRPGQEADEVIFCYYDHTDALDGAMTDVIADAIYIEHSTGQRQKILYADGVKIHAKKQRLTLLKTRQQEP